VSYSENGKWRQAQNAGDPINSETNDACVAISPDGQKMIIYRTAPNQITGNLHITKIGKDGKWEPLQKMGPEVNSSFIETSACFSNDTSEIYFTSNRPGGYGGKDIYRIKHLPNGQWARPFNLGPTVNTLYDEDAPYLHPDGVTLYYSSKGHNTMGEYDVFKSILNTDANTFSKPENLGYPINSVGNDIFFVLSVDGQRAYYSSVKDETFGGNDIYLIDTRFGENDLKIKAGVAMLGDAPDRIKITLIDKENNAVSGTYNSNPKTGKFILVVNPYKPYKAVVEHEGYITLVVNLEPMVNEKTEKDLEFKLEKKKQ
jgi:Tol biopolymer transport system component